MAWPTGILPVLPLRNTVLFPFVSQSIKVGRDHSRKSVEKAISEGSWIICLAQKSPSPELNTHEDFFSVGVLARIENVKKMADGSFNLILRGQRRVEVSQLIRNDKGFWQAQLGPLETYTDLDASIKEGLIHSLRETINQVLEPSEEIQLAIEEMSSLEELSYFGVAHTDAKVADKQNLLTLTHLREISMEALKILSEIKIRQEVQEDIKKKLYSRVGQSQREHILREQMKTIQDELGQSGQDDQGDDYYKKIETQNLPESAKELALQQVRKLEQTNSNSPDYQVTKNHLDFLLSLPWNKSSQAGEINLESARKQLEADHFGLETIKKRILQSLSVLKLTAGKRGSLLLFVGPPGVGKTSLGQSIAKALGRKFARVSLGGIRDDAEIRGHRRTYVGALPGRILSSLKRTGENDAVILLDEIDKLGRSFSGDPASSLLEVLDPEQNNQFYDHYLDTAFDLSHVLFIATANSLESIPGPLLDRMEVIELGSYTHTEKLEIAKQHLWPKSLKDHGIDPSRAQISADFLDLLILRYTREAGVRELQRKLTQVSRYISEKIVTQNEQGKSFNLNLDSSLLEEIFSGERVFQDKNEIHHGPGVVAGLAWTPVGGDLLFIESAKMPGHGKLVLTGKLGETMRESAELALSLLKSRMAIWNVNFDFSKNDLHLHAPAGAIPKDGPSAGVTMLTSLASLLTGKVLQDNQAMTGEISLTGVVLPVGGIKEKLMAAHRYGRTRVLIPAANARDLQQLPEDVRKDLDIFMAHHVDEVLQWALGIDSVKQNLLHGFDAGVGRLTTPDF
jgi:ATP-dependent Lon protease